MNDNFEILNYCHFAKVALQERRANSISFKKSIIDAVSKVQISGEFNDLSLEELCEDIVRFTKNNVENDGDAWNDLNSVSWFMGIHCLVFSESLGIAKFETLFVSSWNKYFATYS